MIRGKEQLADLATQLYTLAYKANGASHKVTREARNVLSSIIGSTAANRIARDLSNVNYYGEAAQPAQPSWSPGQENFETSDQKKTSSHPASNAMDVELPELANMENLELLGRTSIAAQATLEEANKSQPNTDEKPAAPAAKKGRPKK
jgi:hypothetical protein